MGVNVQFSAPNLRIATFVDSFINLSSNNFVKLTKTIEKRQSLLYMYIIDQEKKKETCSHLPSMHALLLKPPETIITSLFDATSYNDGWIKYIIMRSRAKVGQK